MSGVSDHLAKGHAFERRIAELFSQHGYSVETNVVREGRSGARHEIDVLATRSDGLTQTSTFVECKAWSGPVSKDVVAKAKLVMQDVGINHGIVVTLEGWTTGAADTARESGIELWGPDELAERLGHQVLTSLRTAPVTVAQGFPVTVSIEVATRFINTDRGGFLGMGKRAVTDAGLVWTPWHLLCLAVSSETGRFRKRISSRRVWRMYDALEGETLLSLGSAPRPVQVDIASGSLAVEMPGKRIASSIATSMKRYREVTTDAARARHAARLAQLGVELPATAVQVEEQATVYYPVYAAIVRGGGEERVSAVHGHGDPRLDSALGAALTRRLSAVASVLPG